jgi:tetratricopeptide (TPR) repeat protein
MKKKYTYFIVIFLIVASFIVYGRILDNGFISLDDYQYITGNNHIKSGINPESIKWAFSAVVCNNWHPLTWLSHMLDWSLFKDLAGGHHLINLLLHIGGVLFLFFFLNRMTKNLWSSAFVAAFFALHPLRVESVSWASERKDVLSMFFGMASIYAYALYAENYKLSRYFLCLALFVLSLMSKPMLVTMPFVLLLLDYWPLGRWPKALNPVNMQTINGLPVKNEGERCNIDPLEKEMYAPIKSRSCLIGRLLWEKAPFIFLTIVSSIVTLWAQNKGGAVASMKQISFPLRAANAIIAYVSYLGKTFWPVDLAVFYPYEYSFPFWQILVSFFILTGITIAVIYAIKKLPFLFVGWFWYLGTLVPVIGLVQVGKQAMADRYTYLPSIGIAIMLVWGIPLLFPREDMRKKILFPIGLIYLAIMAILTWQQCGYWKNSITLFSHALQVTKNNYLAHDARGVTYGERGQYQIAIEDFSKAIGLKPDYADAYYNRGFAYDRIGQYQLAIEDFSKAIGLNHNYIKSYINRGNVYANLGQYRLAIVDYNEAIRLKPDYADAYYNRGFAYDRIGQYQHAIKDYNKAITIKPDDSDNYNNRGVAYAKFSQYQRAIADFNNAIKLKKDYTDAYDNRANVYLYHGNKYLGCLDARKACELGNCKTLEAAKGRGYCR